MNGPSTAKEAKHTFAKRKTQPHKTTTHLHVIHAKPGPYSDTGAGTQRWGRAAGFPPPKSTKSKGEMSEGHKTPGFPPLAGEMSEGQRGPPIGAGLQPARPLRFSVRGREQTKRCERGMQGTRGQTDASQKPSLLQTPAYPNHHAIYHEHTPLSPKTPNNSG